MRLAKEIRATREEWNRKLDYDSARFEHNEISKLYFSFKKHIHEVILTNKILLALDLYRKFKDLFIDIHSNDLQNLSLKINKSGINKCNKYRNKAAGNGFYNLYVEKYCQTFGERYRGIASIKNFTQDLFAHIKIKLDIKNLPRELHQVFLDKILNDFRNSVWYHPEAKKVASFNGTGNFIIDSKTFPKVKVHEYSVKIPYTAYESVMKTRQVPYKSPEYKCVTSYPSSGYGTDYSSPIQTCGTVYVTRYRSEFYFVNEPVTKYRKESRTFSYNAVEIHSSLYLSVTGKLLLGKEAVPISLMDRLVESDYKSTISMPEIGLHPHDAGITEPIQWLNEKSDELLSEVGDKLSKTWNFKYCDLNNEKINQERYLDSVLKCMRSTGDYYGFVNDWFLSETGLSAKQALVYVKIKNSLGLK